MLNLSELVRSVSLEIRSDILLEEVKAMQLSRGVSDREFKLLAKRKGGIFESAFNDFRYQPQSFWISDFSVKFIDESGKPESGYGQGT